jgi:hypothetical protein
MRERRTVTARIGRTLGASVAISLAVLLVPSGASASASTTDRLVREAAERAGITDSFAGPTVGVDDGGRTFEVAWTIRARAYPYKKWSFMLTDAPGGSGFFATTKRTEDEVAAHQVYRWERRLAPADIEYSRDLRRLHVDTEQHLGSLGRVRLHLQKSSPLTTRTRVCDRTGDELFTTRSRSGLAEGRVRMLPGLTGMPPEVGDLRMRIRMRETRYTGAVCRRGGGPCRSPATITAFEEVSAHEVTVLAASIDGTIAAGRFLIGRRALDTRIVEHLAWDWPAPLRLEPDQAFVSPGYPSGRFQGSLVFDETSDVETFRAGRRCRITETRYTWNSGTMTALLDAGSVSFTGADLEAFTSIARRRT